jgi:hypothetical protein
VVEVCTTVVARAPAPEIVTLLPIKSSPLVSEYVPAGTVTASGGLGDALIVLMICRSEHGAEVQVPVRSLVVPTA